MKPMIGKVKWFNENKGYGFIEHKDYPNVFVHFAAIEGDGYKVLVEDEEVEFEIMDGPKGPQAIRVKRSKQCSHKK